MSEYINFYIRSHGDEFIPLQDFCRVTPIYGILASFLPYGKIKAIDHFSLKQIKQRLESQAKYIKREIELQKDTLNFIKYASDLLVDKLAPRNDVLRTIEEYDDELDIVNSNINFVEVFVDLLTRLNYNSGYDKDKFLYAGIECGDPSIENIDT